MRVGLEEHDRIGVTDRGQQEAVGAFRRRRHHDAQAGDMGEHGLGRLRVMLGGTNAGAMRRAQNHRAAQPPLRSVAEPGRVVHQLIDAGIEESHKLDLADGLKPLRRHADAQPADQRFRQRSVENALDTEALLQAGGRTEYAAIDADIFSENHDIGIIRQSAGERQIDCIDQRDLRHSGPRFPCAGRHRRSAAWHRDGRTWFAADAARSPSSARSPHRRFVRIRRRLSPPLPCSNSSG